MPVPSSDRADTNCREAVRLRRLTDLGMLEIACDDGRRTLVLSGELDLASSWRLDCPLLQIGADGARSFTLDLSGLTFIDSSGVRAVLAARGLCAARGCEFEVVPGPAHVQRVFEMSGHIDHLPFRSQGATEVAEAQCRGTVHPEKQPPSGLRRAAPLSARRQPPHPEGGSPVARSRAGTAPVVLAPGSAGGPAQSSRGDPIPRRASPLRRSPAPTSAQSPDIILDAS
jgi:anti-sigma B factor antagonist